MKHLRTTRDIDAPAPTVWAHLVDLESWPRWGPSIRVATLDGETLGLGATGTVTTAVGLDLSFEVTAFDEGSRWAWQVAGVGATDHFVESLGPTRCRAGFGVPWPAAPYLAVCRVALARLDRLATSELAVR